MSNVHQSDRSDDGKFKPSEEITRLRELLNRALSNDPGMEISVEAVETAGGVSILSINRRISAEAEHFVMPDGAIVIPWAEKFDRQQNGDAIPFKPGEFVQIRGVPRLDKLGATQIHIDADGRVADNFYFDAASGTQLSELIGVPLTAVIRVGEERAAHFRVSNIYNYDAHLVLIEKMPPVNPTAQQVAELPEGTRIVLRGIFIGYQGKPEGEWYEEFNSGLIQTDDSRTLYFDLPYGELSFESGVQENLLNSSPVPGDMIQVAGRVTRVARQPDVLDRKDKIEAGSRLSVGDNANCHLLTPCIERRESYEQLRKTVIEALRPIPSLIAAGDFKDARILLGVTRKQKLTKDELHLTADLAKLFPESERPLLVPNGRYFPTDPPGAPVNYTDGPAPFGVYLETMTKAEFLAFARDVVTHKLEYKGDKYFRGYVLHAASELQVPEREIVDLSIAGIETGVSRFRDGSVPAERRITESVDLGQMLRGLVALCPPIGAEAAIKLMSDWVNRGEFRKKGWRDGPDRRVIWSFVTDAILALYEIPPFNPDDANLYHTAVEENRDELEKVLRTLTDQSDEFGISYLERVLARQT